MSGMSFVRSFESSCWSVGPSLAALGGIFGFCVLGAWLTDRWRRRNHPTERLRVYGQIGTGVYRTGPTPVTRHTATQRLSWADALALLDDHRAGRHEPLYGPTDPYEPCRYPDCDAAFWMVQGISDGS